MKMPKIIGCFQFQNKMIFTYKKTAILLFIVFCTTVIPGKLIAAETGAYSAVGGTATCSAGQILGRLVSGAVGQAVGGLTGKVEDTVKSVINTEVPTRDADVRANTGADAQNTAALRNKTVGGGNPGKSGFLSGIVNSISSVSWDSIMYCIVNEIMTYITQSTIKWINSGFNGSPVFIQNIGAEFKKIGDREASNFMREVSSGAKQAQNIAINGVKNTAFQVAEPLRRGVLNTIGGSRNDQGFSSNLNPELAKNYSSYVGGNWNAKGGGFGGLMQVADPYRPNNQYSANMAARDELNKRIALAEQVQQSQVVNGTRSFYTCRPGAQKRADGTCAPIDQIVTTPAQFINDESSARNGMKYLRLSFAKDFDSVVTALVNQLVKIAINKVYEEVGN